jgi:hypothetical protein
MSNKPRKRSAALLALGTTIAFGAAGAQATGSGTNGAGTFIGSNTTVNPYIVPVDATQVQVTSLLTVADQNAGNGYAMTGIPDGLGAYTNSSGRLELLSNHEIFGSGLNGVGTVRANGKKGSFVSQWDVNMSNDTFLAGADAVASSADLSFAGGYDGDFLRFCSADLSTPNQLFNTANSKGYNGNIFFSGEENGPNGRLLGQTATNGSTNKAQVLKDMGQMSFENALAADTRNSDTVTIAENYDSGPGWNYFYVGDKKAAAPGLNEFDQAGLTGGQIYGVRVDGTTTGTYVTQDMASMSASATGASATYTGANFRDTYGKNSPATFSLVTLSSAGATAGGPGVQGNVGATLQTDAKNKNAFLTDRTEDGAWDPQNPNDYYFVTTGSNPVGAGLTTTLADGRVLTQAGTGTTSNTRSRGGLWRMRFTDRTNPTAGGTLTLLVDGNEANPLYMPDNITIDSHGHIVILEDPGNIDYVAKVWAYDIASNQLAQVAAFDPAQFALPAVQKTTTVSAATAAATTITLTDVTGVTVPALAKVGGEFIRITSLAGNDATVTRAVGGSAAAITAGASIRVFDPTSNTGFLTNDEETSGVLDVEGIGGAGAGTFLLDAQVHTTNTPSSPMLSTAATKIDGTAVSADASPTSAPVENGQYLKLNLDFSKIFPATPTDVPEVPLNVLLPLSAIGVGAGMMMLQRRRRSAVSR